MKEAHDGNSNDVLVADLCVCGIWLPQAETLLDIRVIDTDAQSYLSQSPMSAIFSAKNDLDASAPCRAHFTPLCFSVDVFPGLEAASF